MVYHILLETDTIQNKSSLIKKTYYMIADLGNDNQYLYESNTSLGLQIICPVHRYKITPHERLCLGDFCESELGQTIYSKRRISVEPLIEHIKSAFRVDSLPIYGFHTVSAIVLFFCFIISDIDVSCNCKKNTSNPKSIKYMMGII